MLLACSLRVSVSVRASIGCLSVVHGRVLRLPLRLFYFLISDLACCPGMISSALRVGFLSFFVHDMTWHDMTCISEYLIAYRVLLCLLSAGTETMESCRPQWAIGIGAPRFA